MTAKERFERLYEEHGGAVLAYARRRTAPGNAEDVVAEVFLTAWRRLEDIPPNARIWLLGVARRVLANQRRGQARREALQSRLAGETLKRGELGAADGAEDVMRALAGLSETDREALMLLAWEGLSNRDAALVLGIRGATFAVRAHRARRRLAQALTDVPVANAGASIATPTIATPTPTESSEPTEARAQ